MPQQTGISTVEVVSCRKGQPAGAAELPLLDHVHGLDASDDLHCRPEGLEPHHRPSSPLDGSVSLLNNVAHVLALPKNVHRHKASRHCDQVEQCREAHFARHAQVGEVVSLGRGRMGQAIGRWISWGSPPSWPLQAKCYRSTEVDQRNQCCGGDAAASGRQPARVGRSPLSVGQGARRSGTPPGPQRRQADGARQKRLVLLGLWPQRRKEEPQRMPWYRKAQGAIR